MKKKYLVVLDFNDGVAQIVDNFGIFLADSPTEAEKKARKRFNTTHHDFVVYELDQLPFEGNDEWSYYI